MKISNLFELEPFHETKLLAGDLGIENRVTNATFIDAPDGYEWCKEGDFIVTTGYPFTTSQIWQDGFMKLISKLVEKKCSGLGIKLGRYIPEIPIEVINFADKKNFPIINLPNYVSWTDIIVPIITYINRHHEYELGMTHSVYEKFHNHLKVKGSLEELAYLLHTIIGHPVTIYIRDYNKTIDTHDSKFLEHERDFIMSNLTSNKSNMIQNVNFNNKQFMVKWIYSSGRISGGVFLWGLDSEIKVWEKAAIEQTAVVTALEIEKVRTASKTFQYFRNDFLSVLLNDKKGINRDVIFRRAKELNWNLEDSYKVVLLDCNLNDIPDEFAGPTWQKKISILDALENELKWFLPKSLIGLDSSNRIVFLIPKAEDNESLSEQFKRLIKKVNIISFYGGSGSMKDTEKIHQSYQEAIIAFRVATTNQLGHIHASKQNRLFICNYQDLDVERILYSDNPKEESINIARKHLQQLVDHDKERGSELLNTLKVFIENNANYDETAKSLFIHKNTVRYRINTITNLTNLDLANLKDLLLIQMAMKALTYLQN